MMEHNKIVLITGATSEISCAYLQKLNVANQKNNVNSLILAHCTKINENFMQYVSSLNNLHFQMITADLRTTAGITGFINNIKLTGYIPDHILHLASIPLEFNHLKKISSDRLTEEFNVQVMSLFMLLKEILPLMSKKGGGKVVSVASSCTIGVPPSFMADYVAVKYALVGLIKSAAAEHSGKKININCISPSMVETKFLKNVNPKIVMLSSENSPLKRNITVDEVAGAIEYLLSDNADYITGINLNMSGGSLM